MSDSDEKFAVHNAIKQNNGLLAVSLINENPKVVLLKDEDERTPLHWACSLGLVDVAKALLRPNSQVKDLDIDDLVDASGWTPLHISVATGNLEIVDALMANPIQPDVNVKTGQGTTCVHLAVSKNHFDVAEKLVKAFKASCRVKDLKGSTPLHRAASIGSQPLVKLLVESGKANVNAKDNDGWTPTHHALAEGHGDVGALLVSLGADPEIENADGEKPIAVAADDKVAHFFKNNI